MLSRLLGEEGAGVKCGSQASLHRQKVTDRCTLCTDITNQQQTTYTLQQSHIILPYTAKATMAVSTGYNL